MRRLRRNGFIWSSRRGANWWTWAKRAREPSLDRTDDIEQRAAPADSHFDYGDCGGGGSDAGDHCGRADERTRGRIGETRGGRGGGHYGAAAFGFGFHGV